MQATAAPCRCMQACPPHTHTPLPTVPACVVAPSTFTCLHCTSACPPVHLHLPQVFSAKPTEGAPSRTDQAKQLLTQYGSAYLITSVSFAIISFVICYAAVSAGLDMADLLAQIGIQASDTGEKVGTFAVAYAAHKALSPVRFPPTVALTPVVAKWLGKKVGGGEEGK